MINKDLDEKPNKKSLTFKDFLVITFFHPAIWIDWALPWGGRVTCGVGLFQWMIGFLFEITIILCFFYMLMSS